jgi:ABC-type multidrug transport system ATPase subunit
MIFDEATSSLDTNTETEIQKSLEHIAIGRSSLTIAHRLSTIVNCDKIIVLKQGLICEEGNHMDLLEKKGEYFQMWERQNRIEKLQSSLSDAMSNMHLSRSPSPRGEVKDDGHVAIEVKGSING